MGQPSMHQGADHAWFVGTSKAMFTRPLGPLVSATRAITL
uniref:Uncharacterized protein n=1 Tax=Arundo donax TaxID=35708 RepID=A0A0A9AE77_ARUDO